MYNSYNNYDHSKHTYIIIIKSLVHKVTELRMCFRKDKTTLMTIN